MPRPTRSCATRPSGSAPRRSSSAQQDFSVHEEGGRLVYQDEEGLLDLPRPKLVGRHQFINAGTAIAALRAAGFEQFETAAFEAGLTAGRMAGPAAAPDQGPPAGARAGRLEIWLDGGHNPDGGRVLAAAMADLERAQRRAARAGRRDARHEGFGRFLPQLRRARARGDRGSDPGQIAARPAEEVATIAGGSGSRPRPRPASRRPSRRSTTMCGTARPASSSAARSTSPARCCAANGTLPRPSEGRGHESEAEPPG